MDMRDVTQRICGTINMQRHSHEGLCQQRAAGETREGQMPASICASGLDTGKLQPSVRGIAAEKPSERCAGIWGKGRNVVRRANAIACPDRMSSSPQNHEHARSANVLGAMHSPGIPGRLTRERNVCSSLGRGLELSEWRIFRTVSTP